MSRHRAYWLRPWLIRALIPTRHIGSYVLYEEGDPTYVGRSDTDLRRRLLEHAAVRCDAYFTYDVHPSVAHAFHAECSLFHAIGGALGNHIHPDAPDHVGVRCEFCLPQLEDVLATRLIPINP